MDALLQATVDRLKAVADPSRLRLLAACAAGERSVSELTEALGQSQPRVSRHLKLLTNVGLLERFRDGHWVYFRTPTSGEKAADVRRILGLLPAESRTLREDIERLAGEQIQSPVADPAQRAFNRAVLSFALGKSLGRVLDLGSGTARLLTILSEHATEVIGLERDAELRRSARERLARASLGNCSIRAGDVRRLPFGKLEFDTVVVDEVLVDGEAPEDVLLEAARVLKPTGRLLIIQKLAEGQSAAAAESQVAALARDAELRVSKPRSVPAKNPQWLFYTGELRLATVRFIASA